MTENNFERGDRALMAVLAIGYEDPAETKGIKLPTPDGGEADGPEGYPISDLVADLCHLAQRNGLDPGHLLDEGMQHYGADCVEQAWANSDEWARILQDQSNLERARTVLRTAGVPEDLDYAILMKVGLLPPRDAS